MIQDTNSIVVGGRISSDIDYVVKSKDRAYIRFMFKNRVYDSCEKGNIGWNCFTVFFFDSSENNRISMEIMKYCKKGVYCIIEGYFRHQNMGSKEKKGWFFKVVARNINLFTKLPDDFNNMSIDKPKEWEGKDFNWSVANED